MILIQILFSRRHTPTTADYFWAGWSRFHLKDVFGKSPGGLLLLGLTVLAPRPLGLPWVFPALAVYFPAAGYYLRTSVSKINPSPIMAENGDEKEKRFYRLLGSLARVRILTFST